MKKIGVVKPSIFEDHLIISLSTDWLNYFNKFPEFEIFLDKGFLVIKSPIKEKILSNSMECVVCA